MKQRLLQMGLLVVLCLTFTAAVLAQGGSYDLSWWTVDGGGGASTGGSYAVSGTMGQPDASQMSGGSYRLVGGFWGVDSQTQADHHLYLPTVLR